ncbi:MAG: ABC transporter substrate-binding protein [Methylococcales bacterium]
MLLILVLNASPACSRESVRVGVLAYGTLDWELATIQAQKLDEKYGFVLQKWPLSNPQAGKIALQSGSVDLIISDWVWVSAQRARGFDYTFSPYSTASGSLIVAADSTIHSIEDLPGKRVGIAGGELDKNWLLLIALARKSKNIDLDAQVEKIFGAAPLLNQELLRGELDALLTYWHYAARLEALGYREILNGDSIISGLGIDLALPTLGYVFREGWARAHRELLRNFLQATLEAKNLLCESDSAWEAIGHLTESDDPKVRDRFRQKYCEGRIKQFDDRHKATAAKVFGLLHEVAGARLAGPSPVLAAGTFWND